jgi:hypothetical protein
METKVGQQNIIAATVHMDEKTPHMHLSFCPIAENGKGGKCLSAKSLLGNQASLSQWQTEYHAAMSERWTELERGLSSQITKRKHIPVWLFKSAERLETQLAEVESALEGIHPLNAKKQREQALCILKKWLPQAERFTAQIKTIDEHIKALERARAEAEKQAREAERKADSRVDAAVARTESRMQRSIDNAESLLRREMEKAEKLRSQIRLQESLISRIPLETKNKWLAQMQAQRDKTKHERER